MMFIQTLRYRTYFRRKLPFQRAAYWDVLVLQETDTSVDVPSVSMEMIPFILALHGQPYTQPDNLAIDL